MNAITVDIGNTFIKYTRFENDVFVENGVCQHESELIAYINKYNYSTIVSSVGKNEGDLAELASNANYNVFFLNRNSKCPFESAYDFNTLGFDRIAFIAGLLDEYKAIPLLGIDMGTCITYDYINSSGYHLGGAISPGIKLRFKAMHDFTAKLPLIKEIEKSPMIGVSTQQAMNSGVLEGIIAEINARIIDFQQKEPNLQVVICGGDAVFLQDYLLSNVIYSPQIVSKGLFSILKYNAYIK